MDAPWVPDVNSLKPAIEGPVARALPFPSIFCRFEGLASISRSEAYSVGAGGGGISSVSVKLRLEPANGRGSSRIISDF